MDWGGGIDWGEGEGMGKEEDGELCLACKIGEKI